MMKKHKLLIFRAMSRRMRGKLLWGGLILLTLAVYDLLYQPILGTWWHWVWAIIGLFFVLWVYYAILVSRAAVRIYPNHLVLQGPWRRVKISYGRISSLSSTRLADHYPPKALKRRERKLVKPFFGHTCVLVELKSFPKALKRRYLWFPRSLFSTQNPGLLLLVEDWMALGRDIDAALTRWREKHAQARQEDHRSPAARVLDY